MCTFNFATKVLYIKYKSQITYTHSYICVNLEKKNNVILNQLYKYQQL